MWWSKVKGEHLRLRYRILQEAVRNRCEDKGKRIALEWLQLRWVKLQQRKQVVSCVAIFLLTICSVTEYKLHDKKKAAWNKSFRDSVGTTSSSPGLKNATLILSKNACWVRNSQKNITNRQEWLKFDWRRVWLEPLSLPIGRESSSYLDCSDLIWTVQI